MLAYLDALCAALLARNAIEVKRLLALPAARKLPRAVREEALAITRAGPVSFVAPVNALHLYYKLSHLVDESAEVERADRSAPGGGERATQMEIPFRARRAG